MNMRYLLGIGSAAAIMMPLLALADVGPPAHVQITEREPGLYRVQWRVPKTLPPRAVPEPEFPETCRPAGERTVSQQPGAWLLTREWRCETGLAGQSIGMRYPFPDLALTTVVRVDLLSGERLARVLSPGEGTWRLPEGTAAPDPVLGARRAVLAGVTHAASWLHLAFVIVVVLLGGSRRPVMRLLLLFTLGQVAGALVARLVTGVGAAPATLGFAAATVILARQALESQEQRRRVGTLGVVAGLAHGLGLAALLAPGLGDEASALAAQLIAIVGIDAAQVVGAFAILGLGSMVARRTLAVRMRALVTYATGAASVALCITLALQGGIGETGAVPNLRVPTASASMPSAGGAGSQRVAPGAPDAAVQSFLVVEPFEVRHEAMLKLAGVSSTLGLTLESTLEIDAQNQVLQKLQQLVLESTKVQIDGETPQALVRRLDFMAVDPTGALPRPNPISESVRDAVVGVVVAYPTASMPRTLSFGWEHLPVGVEAVTTTLIDPETVTSRQLSSAEPTLTWENTLAEDPTPTLAAIKVEPITLPLPWLSLLLLAISAIMTVGAIRGRRSPISLAIPRVALALAFVIGPLLQSAVALPGSSGRTPSQRQARRILAGLLPNIYRALEFRDESMIYDRLAVSVTGETLTDVYLEQRRTLEVEERGGAQARVEAVEILEADEIQSRDRGFGVRCKWNVAGMVTHFGHRHFRQNRYDARIEIVPVAGTWKIHRIEILEQERVK
jgi:hypothetical protein